MTTVVCLSPNPTRHRLRGARRIEGRVRDEKGEPIEYVTVLLRQPQDSILIAAPLPMKRVSIPLNPAAPGKRISR